MEYNNIDIKNEEETLLDNKLKAERARGRQDIINMIMRNFIENKLSFIHTDENLAEEYNLETKRLDLEYENGNNSHYLVDILDDIDRSIDDIERYNEIIKIRGELRILDTGDTIKLVGIEFVVRGDIIRTDKMIEDDIEKCIISFDNLDNMSVCNKVGIGDSHYDDRFTRIIGKYLRTIYKHTEEDSKDTESVVRYKIDCSDFRRYLPSYIFNNIIKVLKKELDFKNVKDIKCLGKMNHCTEQYELEFNIVSIGKVPNIKLCYGEKKVVTERNAIGYTTEKFSDDNINTRDRRKAMENGFIAKQSELDILSLEFEEYLEHKIMPIIYKTLDDKSIKKGSDERFKFEFNEVYEFNLKKLQNNGLKTVQELLDSIKEDINKSNFIVINKVNIRSTIFKEKYLGQLDEKYIKVEILVDGVCV